MKSLNEYESVRLKAFMEKHDAYWKKVGKETMAIMDQYYGFRRYAAMPGASWGTHVKVWFKNLRAKRTVQANEGDKK